MSEQSRGFDQWLDAILEGEKPSVDSFAASALNDLPHITTHVRPLNPRVWGFRNQAEMDAAFAEDEV